MFSPLNEPVSQAVLYVVATPIGNLGDITLRALETLKSVDYVICEDTRQVVKLMNHFNFSKPKISYRDENHYKASPKILELLKAGNSLALVSDNGTPLISDPGFKLVNEVLEQGFRVITVPGASGLTAALSICGLPTDKIIFLGFLPRKTGQQAEVMKKYDSLDCTLVVYESPFRVQKTLKLLLDTLGERKAVVAKELTKLHEQTFRGTLSELLAQFEGVKLKGEYIILVAKKDF